MSRFLGNNLIHNHGGWNGDVFAFPTKSPFGFLPLIKFGRSGTQWYDQPPNILWFNLKSSIGFVD